MQLDSHWADIGGRPPESLIGTIREKLNCIGVSIVSGEGRGIGVVAAQWCVQGQVWWAWNVAVSACGANEYIINIPWQRKDIHCVWCAVQCL